jgi:hypothetical protein
MTMLSRAPALKTGDLVHSIHNWRKAGITSFRLGVVHGNFARISGNLLQLDRDFFLTRGEAMQEMLKRVFIAKRALDQHHRTRHAQLDKLIADEQLRAEREATAALA